MHRQVINPAYTSYHNLGYATSALDFNFVPFALFVCHFVDEIRCEFWKRHVRNTGKGETNKIFVGAF